MSRASKLASKRSATPSKRAAVPSRSVSSSSTAKRVVAKRVVTKRAAAARGVGTEPIGKRTAPASKRRGSPAAPAGVDARASSAVSDPRLFALLTSGEIADALRTLSEDRRLVSMYKVGRYRVICTEPLVVKPPHWMATHRLARVVVYDYAADRCVDACIDLDAGVVAHLDINKSQPMLSRDEEVVAIAIASADVQVRERLGIGDQPSTALHYWGRDPSDLAYARRSAAVVFGQSGGHPTLVAVVDLLDNSVTHVVAASQW
jgi:hypothetical protein